MIKNIIQRLYNYLQHISEKYLHIPYDQMIIDENISMKMYGNLDHIGESIDLLTLRDLYEPNFRNIRCRL